MEVYFARYFDMMNHQEFFVDFFTDPEGSIKSSSEEPDFFTEFHYFPVYFLKIVDRLLKIST